MREIEKPSTSDPISEDGRVNDSYKKRVENFLSGIRVRYASIDAPDESALQEYNNTDTSDEISARTDKKDEQSTKKSSNPNTQELTRRDMLKALLGGATAATVGSVAGGVIESVTDPERVRYSSFTEYVNIKKAEKYGPTPSKQKAAFNTLLKNAEKINIPEYAEMTNPVQYMQNLFLDAREIPARNMPPEVRKYLAIFLPGILAQESRFNPYAVSDTGAVGLGQFTEPGVQQVNNEISLRRKAGIIDTFPNKFTKKDSYGPNATDNVVVMMFLHMDYAYGFLKEKLELVGDKFGLSDNDKHIFNAMCCAGQYNIGIGNMRNALELILSFKRADLSQNMQWDYSPQNLYQIMTQIAFSGVDAKKNRRKREMRDYLAFCLAGAELYYEKQIDQIIDRDIDFTQKAIEKGMGIVDFIDENIIAPYSYGIVGAASSLAAIEFARLVAKKDPLILQAIKSAISKIGIGRIALGTALLAGLPALAGNNANVKKYIKHKALNTLPWREKTHMRKRRKRVKEMFVEEGKKVGDVKFNTRLLISKLNKISVNIPNAHTSYIDIRNKLKNSRNYSLNYSRLKIKERAHKSARRLNLYRLFKESDIKKAIRAGKLVAIPEVTQYYRVRGVGMGPVGMHEFRNRRSYLHVHEATKKALDVLMQRTHARLQKEIDSRIQVRFNITGLLRTAALSKNIKQASKASPHEYGLAFDISDRTIDIIVDGVATQFDLKTGRGKKRTVIAKRAFAILMEEMKKMHDNNELVLTFHFTKDHYHITVLP